MKVTHTWWAGNWARAGGLGQMNRGGVWPSWRLGGIALILHKYITRERGRGRGVIKAWYNNENGGRGRWGSMKVEQYSLPFPFLPPLPSIIFTIFFSTFCLSSAIFVFLLHFSSSPLSSLGDFSIVGVVDFLDCRIFIAAWMASLMAKHTCMHTHL